MEIFSSGFLDRILYSLPGIIIGLSFHEFAHAFAAYKMGDPTARNLGRMTLNPLAHLDPIGFLALILFGFGWAKPVPVNPLNYKGNKTAADIIVSLAGIAMNFVLALVCMLIMYLNAYVFDFAFTKLFYIISNMLKNAVIINLALMVFNLIPVPPLDGSHVLEDLLAKRVGIEPFVKMRKYGPFLLIGVLLILNRTGILSIVISALYTGLATIFNFIFGVGVM